MLSSSSIQWNTLVSALFLCFPFFVTAQSFARNGQFFTKGLAISNAPAVGSPQHAGSNIVISIELSGNGKIDQSAFIPNSGQGNRYDSLEIYLVSSQTRKNFTVSSGPALLNQEPGSTVKHLNWPIPRCVPPGSYNLTYYEGSHINNKPFFSITPIPVTMDNPNQDSNASQCDAMSNALSAQPQQDAAPSVSPYLDPSSPLNPSGSSAPRTARMTTISIGTSVLPGGWSVLSNGVATVTVNEPMTTATLVVISSATNGFDTETLTLVMPTADVGEGNFLPVNSAREASVKLWSMSCLTVLTPILFFVL